MNTSAKRNVTMPEPPAFRAPRARRLLDKVKLSPREMEVVKLRARNWDYKDIANLFDVRVRTAEQQVYHAVKKFQRLGCYRCGQRDLMVLFLQAGEITIDDLKFRNDNEI